MTAQTGPDLRAEIEPGASILIDTSVVIAYLTGSEATSSIAAQLFDDLVATGRNPGAISMVTVGEILVRPFRRGPAALANAEGFLRHFGDLRLIPIDYDVAREGARLRALTDLAMPDALIVASAIVLGADLIVTNDRSWPGVLGDAVPRVRVL